jgi:hypothetical protein
MLDEDYRRAFDAADVAERLYLDALRQGQQRDLLTDLAMDVRDRWSAVAMICALAEDAARSQILAPPLRRRRQTLDEAWVDRRNWAVCGEDASARSGLAGALMEAHRGELVPPRHRLSLVSADQRS